MYGIRRIPSILILLFITVFAIADEQWLVQHNDPIKINNQLTLNKLVDLTLQKYPEQSLIQALIEEAKALQQRGNHWLSASPQISFRYQDDIIANNTGLREIESELELPLWNWGQRAAGQNLATQANAFIDKQQAALRLEIAALVRKTLWDMALENIRYQQAHAILKTSVQLLEKIKRRVELGDLPRFDLLLAQGDHLEKQALLVQAEAEMMHARERYHNLTQTFDLPVNYSESQSNLDSVDNHPALQAMNALIVREKANLAWITSKGSGQPIIALGGKSERGSRIDDDIESMSITISIPFGGAVHLAPQIAAANISLTKIIAQRDHLYRKLKGDLHEIKHQLEVNHTELELAAKLEKIAQQHLEMAQFGFAEGEINLMDLLKVQTKSHNAKRHAKEHQVMLQRNISLYNQIVGVQP
jgi:outer membrane protein TolC